MSKGKTNNYRSVHELTPDELQELRCNYYAQLVDSGEIKEIDPEGKYDWVTGMPEDLTIKHYESTSFVKDDFFCNQNK